MRETSVPISAKGPRHKNHSFNEIIPLRAANALKQRTSEDAVWSREIQLGQCPQDVPLSTQAVVFIQVWWNQYKFLMKCSKDKNISDRSACSQLNITAFLKWALRKVSLTSWMTLWNQVYMKQVSQPHFQYRIFHEKKKTVGRYLILSIGNWLDCERRLYILEWSQGVGGMFRFWKSRKTSIFSKQKL